MISCAVSTKKARFDLSWVGAARSRRWREQEGPRLVAAYFGGREVLTRNALMGAAREGAVALDLLREHLRSRTALATGEPYRIHLYDYLVQLPIARIPPVRSMIPELEQRQFGLRYLPGVNICRFYETAPDRARVQYDFVYALHFLFDDEANPDTIRQSMGKMLRVGGVAFWDADHIDHYYLWRAKGGGALAGLTVSKQAPFRAEKVFERLLAA